MNYIHAFCDWGGGGGVRVQTAGGGVKSRISPLSEKLWIFVYDSAFSLMAKDS